MTAIAAAARGSAGQYLMRVALVLSLVLNLCFVGGAMWIRTHAPRHSGMAARFQRIESRLALDPAQRQAFDHYAATMEARVRLLHQHMRPLFIDAWQEMAKPQAKAADVMQIFDRVGATRHGFEQDLTNNTLAFFAHLSPAQRQKFVALLHSPATRRR